MSDTTVASDNRVQQWADDEFFEYVRSSALRGLMGTGENSVVQVKEELQKDAGDRVTISLITKLSGAGVAGDNQLEGNEEALGNYGHRITVDQLRNGVVIGRMERVKTKIDLLRASRTMLRVWNREQLRDLFIARFLSPVIGGLTTYAASTETERDAWLVANNPATSNQRILFGTAKSNQSGDHSADLANIDGTADEGHQDIVRLVKRLAQGCDPHIRPVMTEGKDAGRERFCLLMGSLPFRDLQGNFETVQSNADVRGEDNNIFAAGDIKVGNVICKEIPEMDRTIANGGTELTDVGAGSIEVQPTFFCGAQTLGLAWAQRMQVNLDDFDYKNKRGVACSEIRGCEKLTYNSFQHGMATSYVSSVGD